MGEIFLLSSTKSLFLSKERASARPDTTSIALTKSSQATVRCDGAMVRECDGQVRRLEGRRLVRRSGPGTLTGPRAFALDPHHRTVAPHCSLDSRRAQLLLLFVTLDCEREESAEERRVWQTAGLPHFW